LKSRKDITFLILLLRRLPSWLINRKPKTKFEALMVHLRK
jgi:hypothetical protein